MKSRIAKSLTIAALAATLAACSSVLSTIKRVRAEALAKTGLWPDP